MRNILYKNIKFYKIISVIVFSGVLLFGLAACQPAANDALQTQTNAVPPSNASSGNTDGNSAVYQTYGVHNEAFNQSLCEREL